MVPHSFHGLYLAAVALGLTLGTANLASADCLVSALETGTSFGCDDGSVGTLTALGDRLSNDPNAGEEGDMGLEGALNGILSYATSNGEVGFLVGSGNSAFYSDDRGRSGVVLEHGKSLIVDSGDGSWGIATRHGNSLFVDLPDPAWEDPTILPAERDLLGPLADEPE